MHIINTVRDDGDGSQVYPVILDKIGSDVIDVIEPNPNENEIHKDDNNERIYIRRVLRSAESAQKAQIKKNAHINNSVHACIYCGKLFSHIRAQKCTISSSPVTKNLQMLAIIIYEQLVMTNTIVM